MSCFYSNLDAYRKIQSGKGCRLKNETETLLLPN